MVRVGVWVRLESKCQFVCITVAFEIGLILELVFSSVAVTAGFQNCKVAIRFRTMHALSFTPSTTPHHTTPSRHTTPHYTTPSRHTTPHYTITPHHTTPHHTITSHYTTLHPGSSCGLWIGGQRNKAGSPATNVSPGWCAR